MNKTALLLPLLALLLSCGLLEQSTGGDASMMSAEPPYRPHVGGLYSLEEMIAGRNTIVRATMTATSSDVVLSERAILYDTDRYWVVRKFTFTALEYLKGSGPDSFTAVWVHGNTYETRAEAEEVEASILAAVDAGWENTANDAILFLHSTDGPKKEGQILYELLNPSDHFFLGLGEHYGPDDMYSLHSDIMRAWLPRPLSEPCPVGSPCTAATKYRTASPPASEFIATARLKQIIVDITVELAVDTSEEYQRCVVRKYEELRRARNWLGDTGYRYTTWPQDDPTVAPGAPAGTEVARRTFSWGDYPDPAPTWMRNGLDAALFRVGVATSTDPDIKFMERITTARPLISGQYTFVVEDNWQALQQCEYVAHTDFTVEATAQAGATHEFFFDPVTVGSAVAADASNGVLKPSSFTGADNATSTISSMAWEPSATSTGARGGQVKLLLTSDSDPDEVIGEHILDFIELDGTVSLSLDVFDAAVASQSTQTHTLSWTVSSQPWESGDELMVRIR